MGRTKEVENLNSSEVACPIFGLCEAWGIRREHHDLMH
jgi:hypothetical protein